MKLDFTCIEEAVIPAFKGGEKETRLRIHVDESNRIMKGCLIPGASIGMHTHESSSEIIYILSGVGTMVCQGETEILLPGQVHYCKKGETHSLMNRGTEDLIFFAVVPEQ